MAAVAGRNRFTGRRFMLSVPAVAAVVTPHYPACSYMVDALPAMFWAMTRAWHTAASKASPGQSSIGSVWMCSCFWAA